MTPAARGLALYRMGEWLVARLPRLARTAAQVVKEQRWLPFLAPYLPLPVPEPVAAGCPSEEYPFDWSVCRWLDGHDAIVSPFVDQRLAASQLASFIGALRGVDPTDGPRPGHHNFGRGVPLAWRDTRARGCLVALADVIDVDRAVRVWDGALSTPEWSQPGRWIHGDLLPGNLLVNSGHLAGVIDFGGVGDLVGVGRVGVLRHDQPGPRQRRQVHHRPGVTR